MSECALSLGSAYCICCSCLLDEWLKLVGQFRIKLHLITSFFISYHTRDFFQDRLINAFHNEHVGTRIVVCNQPQSQYQIC